MNPYAVEVSRHLTGLRPADRAAALADLEDLLSSGVTAAELGSPQEYAAGLREALGRSRLRLPGGFVIDRAARSRMWAPEDPRLFVPRGFGLGWRVNVGNLAVRLGWLRPDDADAAVFEAIPGSVRLIQRLTPVALAVLTAAAAAALWRTGERIPFHFDPAGRVDRWGDRRWLLAVVAGSGAMAGWGAQAPAAQDEDAVARPAIATSAGALCLLFVLTTLAGARSPEATRPWLVPVAVLTPTVAELAATVLPMRAGLARVTGERAR